MKRSTLQRLTTWGLLLALCVAVAAACHDRRETQFPHRLHLTGLQCGAPGQPECLNCASCHGPAEDAQQREPQRPMAQRCESCHAKDAALLLERTARHELQSSPVAHGIRFNHAKHLAMPQVRGQCVGCHSGAVQNTSELFPPMVRCFECHEHEKQWAEGKCTPCHDPLQVRQLVPQTFARHDQAWLRHHGDTAAGDPELCGSCHSQQQCDDCHDLTQGVMVEQLRPDAVERNWTHPADFLTRHAIEARSVPGKCLTCHTTPSCDGCHLERGVSANAIGAVNPHPVGWVGGNPASRDFHGRAARRDLLSCASCHDRGPATNCIQCHRVGGQGGNPHPRGAWTLRSEDSSMCRYCHER